MASLVGGRVREEIGQVVGGRKVGKKKGQIMNKEVREE